MFGEFPEDGRFTLRSFRQLDGSTEDLSGGAGAELLAMGGGGVGEGGEEVGEDVILGLELQQDSVSLF